MTAAVLTGDAGRTAGRTQANRALVRGWLYVALIVLFALVLVGGATRLTNSGLSITEWQPIHGVIPPLNDAQWQEEFARYKQIPQYARMNADMTLPGFKSIYWWEWTHRLLARSIGVVFALPLLLFWVTGRLERGLKPKLLGILALGGFQGAVGWWMVASGLVYRTEVSQYRLATHLTIASVILAAIAYVARGLAPHSEKPASRGLQRVAGLIVFLVLVQIYLGGLVAGLRAGLSYNTWPLMDGAVWPHGLLVIEPAWRNFFENPKTVQFVHRLGAYTVFVVAWLHAIAALRMAPGTTHSRRAVLLALIVTCQATIGITALLLQVPLGVALLHQGFAIFVLFAAVAHWRGTKGAFPERVAAAAR
jgi:heme a synthase